MSELFTTQFLNFVKQLLNERRRILFGNAERLKQLFADYGIPPTDVRYSIFNKFFCIQLKIYINFYFLYFKSSIRSFSSFLRKDHKGSNLLDSYENKYKLAPADLAFKNRNLKDFRVFYNEQLENDYVKKLVTSKSDLDGDGIRIIGENESVVLKDEDDCIVGAVIRQATSQNATKHFGAKIKVTIESHYPLKRGPEHASAAGIMAGHGPHANITPIPTDSYSYNKHLDPHTQRIFDTDGNTLAKWLFEYGKHYLPYTTVSYEEFRDNLNLEEDDIIGAVFCTKNYEAVGHRDKDRSEWAIGFVYEDGPVNDGYFFYPGYGVAIKLTSNSIWCWLPQAVHSTSKLDTELGNRYTAVLTLSEKTATAIENRLKKNN